MRVAKIPAISGALNLGMQVYSGRVLGVIAAALGGPEVLRVTELPDPEAGPGQVVVRIRAVCVHPADVAATTGEIPRGPVLPPFLPGWDIAGDVASVGPDTAEFRVGDRVVGMIPWYLTRGAPGGYAEFVAADAGWLVPLPDGLDFVPAATVPLNAQTAHQGLALCVIGHASGRQQHSGHRRQRWCRRLRRPACRSGRLPGRSAGQPRG